MITGPAEKQVMTTDECFRSLETLFKAYQKDSEFNYQLISMNSAFNQLKIKFEALEHIKFLYDDLVQQYELELEKKSKKEQALEIIKERKINVSLFLEYNVDTYKDYIITFKKVNLGKELLTEEEYDLLKEVLR